MNKVGDRRRTVGREERRKKESKAKKGREESRRRKSKEGEGEKCTS